MTFNFLRKFFRKRAPKPKTKPVRTITEGELAARFASAPDNPLFEAIMARLGDAVNSKATQAANEQLTDRQILWRVAGTDALMEFYEELRDREAAARAQQQEQGDLATDGHR